MWLDVVVIDVIRLDVVCTVRCGIQLGVVQLDVVGRCGTVRCLPKAYDVPVAIP